MSIKRFISATVFLLAVTSPLAAQTIEKREIVAGEEYAGKSRSYKRLLGTGYRQLWGTPIEIEVLDLAGYAGGLTPVRRVGGLQTSSLALVGADGRAYTFRPVSKNAAGLVPPEFIGTPLDDLVQDQMSAQHPAGSIVVPELSEAAGVLETKHRFVVMPDDPLLGKFREDYRGLLGTISVYPLPVSSTNPGFHDAQAIIGTSDLWDYYKSDPNQRPDTEAYLKARLLDLVVGDWDRHQGQWRWAKLPGEPLWQPIAEDRDQAFSNYDGFAMSVARLTGLPQFNPFKEEYPSMGGLTFNAWPIDRLLLTDLEWTDWQRVALELQSELTDQAIDDALEQLPREYFDLTGSETRNQLVARRNALADGARDFYLHLSGEVDVICTDGNELVHLNRSRNGTLEVSISKTTQASPAKPYFKRVFHSKETREIRIYLQEGLSRIKIEGHGRNAPDIYLIGRGQPVVEGDSRKLSYVDLDSPRKILTSTDEKALYGIPDPNEGTPWMRPRDWGRKTVPLTVIDYMSDAGIVVGAGVESQSFGFDKAPYAQRHVLRGGWAFVARQPVIEYFGEHRRRQHSAFFSLGASLSGLKDLRFYGFGNETESDGPSDRYRIDSLQFSVFPALTWSKGPVFEVPSLSAPPHRSTVFRIGPLLKYSSSSGEPGGVLEEKRPYGTDRFGQIGLGAMFSHDGRKTMEVMAPGFRTEAEAFYFFETWDVRERYGSVRGLVAGYFPLGSRSLLAAEIEGKKLYGEYPFFEAASLGGRRSIGGYKTNRYSGESSLLGSAELRFRVVRLKFPVPGTVGVLGGANVGRVFWDGETSSKWHPAAGGGVFFEMLRGLSVFSLSVWRGREDTTFHFRAGFDF